MRLMAPASFIVPGKPSQAIRTKPDTSTPIAAPILLVKYSIARLPPGVEGYRRNMPVLIKGKVIPSNTDCGKISRAAADHLSIEPTMGTPVFGRMER